MPVIFWSIATTSLANQCVAPELGPLFYQVIAKVLAYKIALWHNLFIGRTKGANMKKTNVKAELIAKATNMGRAAFLSGKTKAPYYDSEFMALIFSEFGQEVSIGHKERCAMMDAWACGWVSENLK